MKKSLASLLTTALLAGILSGCGGQATSVSETTQVATNQNSMGEALSTADNSGAVYASELKEGVYPVKVDSSSSMFRVTDCALTVSDGELSAVMTMGGKGYLYVYPGTAEEAENAPETEYIPFIENAEGAHTFSVPVTALDMEIPCAAYSKNREQWYHRTLVFRSDSLPPEAFTGNLPVTPQTLGLSDGAYTVEVRLNGGSGRTSVESPAALTVRDGICMARITWGSPHFDYMKVNGEQYFPVNTDGNSAFEIPVETFDRPLTVYADTTAMSQPHEIEYELTFVSATIQSV